MKYEVWLEDFFFDAEDRLVGIYNDKETAEKIKKFYGMAYIKEITDEEKL